MTTTPRLLMTEEEFLAKYADELPSYEFVNGEVTQKPMTKNTHFRLADEIGGQLREYRRRAGGMSGQEPTIDFSQGATRIYRVPDVAYWAPAKEYGGEIMLPPTLAVEIPSPGQTIRELRAKCRFMRAGGVEVCWLVDPDRRTVEVFDDAQDSRTLSAPAVLESPHMPGFRLPLDELFSVLDA